MRLGLLLIILFSAAGCSGSGADPAVDIAVQTIPSATPIPRITPTLQPPLIEPTATPVGPTQLVIWMPEPLAPQDNLDAADQREAWRVAFEASEQNSTFDIRLKKATDVGGILQTLRSASLVAPGALPDLALLRRTDLIAAVSAGLIQPLDTASVASMTDDMHPAVIELGRVGDQLYGLPYTVDVSHLAVQPGMLPAETSGQAWSFDAVLQRSDTLLFPAGRANILNDTFLAQYRSAAATPDRTSLPVDVDALQAVLGFYEQAVAKGIIPPDVLTYTSSNDYTATLIEGVASMGVMSSSSYLNLRDAGAPLDYAPLPTLSGDSATIIDGWMWVITTADAGRQALALRFLNWIFDIDRHATYSNAINMLPTGRATLRKIDDQGYSQFVDLLLAHATLPLTDAAGGAAGRAMQGALVSVLQGVRSAQDAALDVIEQLNTG